MALESHSGSYDGAPDLNSELPRPGPRSMLEPKPEPERRAWPNSDPANDPA
jgi:hypothetical protein